VNALTEEIHIFFEGHSPWVSVELRIQTAGTYDIQNLKQGKDFIADLVNLCDDVDKDTLNSKIRDSIKPVFESWAGRKYLEEISTEEMGELIHKSRNLALDQLVDNS
ncbi:MAG: hypothetical protein ACI9UO_002480, partial [Nitrospinales bacterium]